MSAAMEHWQAILAIIGGLVAVLATAIGGGAAWNRFVYRQGSWRKEVMMRLKAHDEADKTVAESIIGLTNEFREYVKESREHRTELGKTIHEIDKRLVRVETNGNKKK